MASLRLQRVRVSLWIFALVLAMMLPSPYNRRQLRKLAASHQQEAPQQKAEYQPPKHFESAYQESLHFFDDIPDIEWVLMKEKAKQIMKFTRATTAEAAAMAKLSLPQNFYQTHYEPFFACRHERRIGNRGDGGKWVCDPHRLKTTHGKTNRCLVYSVGSSGRFDFEKSVLDDIGSHCEIHTFDFGNYSHMAPAGVHYHQWGLAAESDPSNKFKTLQQTTKELGHRDETIDIFKIGKQCFQSDFFSRSFYLFLFLSDCEGCEWTTVNTWFDADVTLRQILVEVHGVKDETVPFFETLYRNNYVITHKEPNILGKNMGALVEFAFLKLGAEFLGQKQSS